MKKIIVIPFLLSALLLFGCENTMTKENTILKSDLATSENTKSEIHSSSAENSNLNPKPSQSESLQDLINESFELARVTEALDLNVDLTDEEIDDLTCALEDHVNGIVESSLDLSEIPSDKIDVEGFGSFIKSIVDTALDESSLENVHFESDLSSNSSDDKVYTIDDLYQASLSNNIDLVKSILESDTVDINAKTSNDSYVLETVMFFNNCEMLKILLQSGADPDNLNSDGISFKDQIQKDNNKTMNRILDDYI